MSLLLALVRPALLWQTVFVFYFYFHCLACSPSWFCFECLQSQWRWDVKVTECTICMTSIPFLARQHLRQQSFMQDCISELRSWLFHDKQNIPLPSKTFTWWHGKMAVWSKIFSALSNDRCNLHQEQTCD